MVHSITKKNEAKNWRLKGFSVKEISKLLKISTSTASVWIRDVALSPTAKNRLILRKKIGNRNAINSKKWARLISDESVRTRSKHSVNKIVLDTALCKLACSLLYWGEGSKTGHRVIFTNSDPKMISTFLWLLRKGFSIDEQRFRALIHIHEYHNELEIKEYWSTITQIPIPQFSKSYLKPHTANNSKAGYKGTVVVKYGDSSVFRELISTYEELVKKILGL